MLLQGCLSDNVNTKQLPSLDKTSNLSTTCTAASPCPGNPNTTRGE